MEYKNLQNLNLMSSQTTAIIDMVYKKVVESILAIFTEILDLAFKQALEMSLKRIREKENAESITETTAASTPESIG